MDVLTKRQVVGILEESISGGWGTPKTASSQFKRQLYNVGQSIPDFGKTESQFEMTGAYSEMKEQNRRVNDSITGLKRIPFSGFATRKNISDHLIACLWDLYGTEGGSPSYTKVFNCGNDQYAFESGEGVTFSIGLDNNHQDDPESISDGIILENAVIDDLTLECDMMAGGKDKYMKMSGNWVGRNMQTEVNFTSAWLNEDGTAFSESYSPTFYNVGDSPANWFNLSNATFTIGGDNIASCMRKFSITINNQLFSDCVTTGGKPNNYKRKRMITMTIDLPYNTSTYKAVKGYKDGDVVVLGTFNNGTVFSTLGGIQISNSVNYLTSQPQVVEGDYWAIRLEMEMYRPNGGFVGLIGLSDGISKGW